MQMDDDVAIKIDSIGKTFKLPHDKRTSVKSVFTNMFKKNTYETQTALKDISFEVKKGEFFGIVGRNGCGKSTLLKILAGIYYPTQGEIKIDGKLTAFIELGVGFNPDLTGKENVYLNGALFGFNRKEVDAMYPDIVDFAELERFMDQKLKNYSSGMQVRLAFSIATRARSDILLLDEVLAVGDSAFQKKCLDYFAELRRKDKTLVLVSHDMVSVEKYCDRAMLIEKGVIQKIGPSSEIAQMYEDMFVQEEIVKQRQARDSGDNTNFVIGDEIRIKEVKVSQDGKVTNKLKARQDFEIELKVRSLKDTSKVNLRLNLKNRQGLVVIATDTKRAVGYFDLKKDEEKTFVFKYENILTNGLYSVNIGGVDASEKMERSIVTKRPIHEFGVSGIEEYVDSITHPTVKISVVN